MRWSEKDDGFTLLEVLLALVISGILLMTSMRLITDQLRGARALKNHLEAHYSVMTAGNTVSNAIRMAKTVAWINDYGVLKVFPMPNNAYPAATQDSYYMDDADKDGIIDIYWKHLGSPQPLASHISKWECKEVEPGLWEVVLEASVDGQIVTWRSITRQRVLSAVSPVNTGQRVMLAFLSSFF